MYSWNVAKWTLKVHLSASKIYFSTKKRFWPSRRGWRSIGGLFYLWVSLWSSSWPFLSNVAVSILDKRDKTQKFRIFLEIFGLLENICENICSSIIPAIHTPSSNPRLPKNLHFTETLRRPVRSLQQKVKKPFFSFLFLKSVLKSKQCFLQECFIMNRKN